MLLRYQLVLTENLGIWNNFLQFRVYCLSRMPRDTQWCNSARDHVVSGNAIEQMEKRHYYSSLLGSGKYCSRKWLNRASPVSSKFQMCPHTHARTSEWDAVPNNYLKYKRSRNNKCKVYFFNINYSLSVTLMPPVFIFGMNSAQWQNWGDIKFEWNFVNVKDRHRIIC